LFVYTDYVGAGRSAFSWEDLRGLRKEGFDVQLHSKTHEDLRRKPSESDADYEKRMQAELGQARILLERQLGQTSQILAYPYGSHDPDVVRWVREQGYAAALDVRRQANPAFTPNLTLHRSQIYSEMSLEEFARNLNVFDAERVQ
ncbi:MAG: polysaccharide deacetylase family protein, partial [Candidatus Rokuibacteriota bacterium]